MKRILNLLTLCTLCIGFAINASAQGTILSADALNNSPTGTKIVIKSLSGYFYWFDDYNRSHSKKFWDRNIYTIEKADDNTFYLSHKREEFPDKEYIVNYGDTEEHYIHDTGIEYALKFRAEYIDTDTMGINFPEYTNRANTVVLRAVNCNDRMINYWPGLTKDTDISVVFNVYDVSDCHKVTVRSIIDEKDIISEEFYVKAGETIPAPEHFGCTVSNYTGIVKDTSDTQVVEISYKTRQFDLNEDVTALLKNPDFSESDYGWENIGDAWNKTAVIYSNLSDSCNQCNQTCKYAPTGLYEVSLNSVYGSTGYDTYNAYKENKSYGIEINPDGYVYVNNNNTASNNIYDEPIELGTCDTQLFIPDIENSIKAYPAYIDSAVFNAGYYRLTAFGVVTEESEGLSIGAKVYQERLYIDNFKIIYRGKQKKYVMQELQKELAYLISKKSFANNSLESKINELEAEAEAVINSGDSIAMFDLLTAVYELKDSIIPWVRAYNDISLETRKLQSEIEGLEGDSLIPEINTLIDNILNGTADDIETIEEIGGLKDSLVTMLDKVKTIVSVPSQNPYNCYEVIDSTFSIPYSLKNIATNFTAFQCRITLPEGFSIAKNESGSYNITLNRERVSSSHTITAELQNDGSYLVVCYSSKNDKIKGYDGELFYVNVCVDENIKNGYYNFRTKEFILSTTTGKEITDNWFNQNWGEDIYLLKNKFDLNNDGEINEDDLNDIVSCYLGSKYIEKAFTDLNIDNSFDTRDIVAMIGAIAGTTSTQDTIGRVGPPFDERVCEYGDTILYPVKVDYDGTATLYAGEIYLPEGLNIAKNENGEYDIQLTERVTASHKCVVYKRPGDIYTTKILIYSTENKPFKGNSGPLYNFKLISTSSQNLISRGMMIYNHLCSPGGIEYNYTIDYVNEMLGDGNGDGHIDENDLGYIPFIWGGQYSLKYDVNKDDSITIGDYMAIYDATINNGKLEKSVNIEQAGSSISLGLKKSPMKNNYGEYPLYINSDRNVTAVKCKLSSADGITIEEITLAEELKETTDLFFHGNLMIVRSLNNNPLNGEFAKIKLHRNDNSNNTEIEFKNASICTTDSVVTEYRFVDFNQKLNLYKAADANGDDRVSVSDVVLAVSTLLNEESGTYAADASDMDNDGEITIADIVAVVNVLLDSNAENQARKRNADRSIDTANMPASEFKVNDAYFTNGEATLYVKLDKADNYNAMQFDIDMPEGVSIKEIAMQGKHIATHNDSRVVAYSLTNSTFNSQEDVMTITLGADADVADGQIIFSNIYATTADLTEKQIGPAASKIGGTTDINRIEASKVYAKNGCIVIETEDEGIAEIISANGTILKAELASGKNSIAVEEKGVYIVKIGNKTVKIRL